MTIDEDKLWDSARANYIGQHERMVGADEAAKEWDQLPGSKRMDYRTGALKVIEQWQKSTKSSR